VEKEEEPRKGVEMLNADGAAEVLGCSRRQVYRLVQTHAIPHVHLGGTVRFEKNVLEQWIRDEMMKGVRDGGEEAREAVERGLLRAAGGRGPDAIPPFAWGGRRLKDAG